MHTSCKILIWTIIKFLATLVILCSASVKGQDSDSGKVHDSELELRNMLQKNRIVDVMPPHNTTNPVKVQIGMTVLLVKDLDPKAQILSTVVWLVVSWQDSRLKWNTDDYSNITMIPIKDHSVWYPDIKLYNSAEGSKIDYTNDQHALLSHTGLVTWIPPAILNSLCEVDLTYYPYDEHKCLLKFGSWTSNGKHIDLDIYTKQEEVDISLALNKGGEWKITAYGANKTVKLWGEDPYVDVTFWLMLCRRSPFFKVAIICPIITALILTLASLWITPVASERIHMNGLSVLILVLTLLYLNSTLPSAGNVIPLIFICCGIFLIFALTITISTIIFSTIVKHSIRLPLPIKLFLDSRAVKFLSLWTSSVKHEPFSKDEESGCDGSVTESKSSKISMDELRNQWLLFFTVFDRILFIVFCIVAVSTLIASAI